MDLLQTILASAVVILFVICVILIILRVKQNKELNALNDSINSFLSTEKKTDFSVNDDLAAELQNGVNCLEELVLLERSKAAETARKNTEFIADISHQLKTPIAGLRLYCEMEDAENPTEHTKKELQLIEKTENLVYDLLKMEKIRSDTYVMDFEYGDLEETVRSITEELRFLFPGRNIAVSGKSRLRYDKTWLKEAIMNVIKNACEHTSKNGNINIQIEDNTRSTIITVSDDGGGMSENELPELFTRFFKAGNSLPTSSGIGMAITKLICEKHHGIISAENKNGGLLITICLPHIDGMQSV